jgi:2-iminobutanoate/2-iminopropanoate deaminase
MRTTLAPTDIAKPASAYQHRVLLTSPTRLVRVAGQVGEWPDGHLDDEIRAQSDRAWSNVEAILREGGMGIADITKVTSYIVGRENIDGYAEVHKRRTADVQPPWTLLLVAGLGKAQYLVEIDVEAAQ